MKDALNGHLKKLDKNNPPLSVANKTVAYWKERIEVFEDYMVYYEPYTKEIKVEQHIAFATPFKDFLDVTPAIKFEVYGSIDGGFLASKRGAEINSGNPIMMIAANAEHIGGSLYRPKRTGNAQEEQAGNTYAGALALASYPGVATHIDESGDIHYTKEYKAFLLKRGALAVSNVPGPNGIKCDQILMAAPNLKNQKECFLNGVFQSVDYAEQIITMYRNGFKALATKDPKQEIIFTLAGGGVYLGDDSAVKAEAEKIHGLCLRQVLNEYSFLADRKFHLPYGKNSHIFKIATEDNAHAHLEETKIVRIALSQIAKELAKENELKILHSDKKTQLTPQAKPYQLDEGNIVLGITRVAEEYIIHGQNYKGEPRSIRVNDKGDILNYKGGPTINGSVDRLMKEKASEIFQHFNISMPKKPTEGLEGINKQQYSSKASKNTALGQNTQPLAQEKKQFPVHGHSTSVTPAKEPYQLDAENKATGIQQTPDGYFIHGQNNIGSHRCIQVKYNGVIHNHLGGLEMSGHVSELMKQQALKIFDHFQIAIPDSMRQKLSEELDLPNKQQYSSKASENTPLGQNIQPLAQEKKQFPVHGHVASVTPPKEPYQLDAENNIVTGIEPNKGSDGGFIINGKNDKWQDRSIKIYADGSIHNFKNGSTINGRVDVLMKQQAFEIFDYFNISIPDSMLQKLTEELAPNKQPYSSKASVNTFLGQKNIQPLAQEKNQLPMPGHTQKEEELKEANKIQLEAKAGQISSADLDLQQVLPKKVVIQSTPSAKLEIKLDSPLLKKQEATANPPSVPAEIKKVEVKVKVPELALKKFPQTNKKISVTSEDRPLIQNQHNFFETKEAHSLKNSTDKNQKDDAYPIWLILLFCIPVFGQLGFIIYEIAKCCMPEEENQSLMSSSDNNFQKK